MDRLSLQGKVSLYYKSPTREFSLSRDNLIVQGGFSYCAGRLVGNTSAPLSHIAMGSSNQVPTLEDTGLIGTQLERIAAGTGVASNVVTLTANFGAAIISPQQVGEFGVFNAASGGTMFSRFIVPVFTFEPTATLAIVWKIFTGAIDD